MMSSDIVPFICYIDDSVSKLEQVTLTEKRSREEIVINFIFQFAFTAGKNLRLPLPADANYVIAFFWVDGSDLFVDLWIQRQLETYGASAPMTTLVTYNAKGEMIDPFEKGNACGDTRIVSGREEEYRRQLVESGGTLEDYFNHPRPQMPEGLIAPWPKPYRKTRVKGGYGDLS